MPKLHTSKLRSTVTPVYCSHSASNFQPKRSVKRTRREGTSVTTILAMTAKKDGEKTPKILAMSAKNNGKYSISHSHGVEQKHSPRYGKQRRSREV